MSTKIYSAYHYTKSIDTLMKHIHGYRLKWREWQADRIVDIIISCKNDTQAGLHKELFDSDGKFLYKRLDELVDKDTRKPFKSYGDIFDIGGSVVVYFHKKHIYVQTFLEANITNSSKPPVFVNKDMVDYHYQDQSDPYYDYLFDDKKITAKRRAILAKDWKQRKAVWDAIFDKDWSPANAGLTYEMVGNMDIFSVMYTVCDKLRDAGIIFKR